MSTEENKALVRRSFDEIWSKGNLDTIDKFFATDYIIHNLADPTGEQRGGQSVKQIVTVFRTAFPDASISVEDMITEGDKVATRYTWHGTHKGPLWGIAPTGMQATVTGIVISRFVDGKFVEEWGVVDMLGLMYQLGVVPPIG